ncbi:MAG: tyrosine-type recombinase/integrase [Desulfomonilaceae bacterium]
MESAAMITENLPDIIPPTVPAQTIKTEDLLDAFLSNKSEKTILAYKRDLEQFRQFLGAENINEAAKRFFAGSLGEANYIGLRYKQHLINRSLQATTINRKLAALRSFSDMAYTLGMVNWRIRIKNQKVYETSRDTTGPGKTGVQKLREEISRRNDAKGLRDNAIIHLLFDLALRRSEVVGIDLEDVDLERGTLRILGKGRLQKETLTIPTRTRKVLKNWMDVRADGEGPLFINFHHNGTVNGKRLTCDGLYYVVKDLGTKTGQKVRPHGLRHTSISEAVRKSQSIGMDVTKVLKFSRHKNLNTLQIYIDAVEGAQGEIAELVAMD